jgi:hypothetical protein
MIKLYDPARPGFLFTDVKQQILDTGEGFGIYTHDALRAKWLLLALETLKTPDMVVRTAGLATSDRAFIKNFGRAPYPYVVALVGRDGGLLTLRTAFPCKRNRMKKWATGEVLFPKTPQPPVEEAV